MLLPGGPTSAWPGTQTVGTAGRQRQPGRRVGEGQGLPRVVQSWAAALQAHGAEGARVTTGGLGMQDIRGGGRLHGGSTEPPAWTLWDGESSLQRDCSPQSPAPWSLGAAVGGLLSGGCPAWGCPPRGCHLPAPRACPSSPTTRVLECGRSVHPDSQEHSGPTCRQHRVLPDTSAGPLSATCAADKQGLAHRGGTAGLGGHGTLETHPKHLTLGS